MTMTAGRVDLEVQLQRLLALDAANRVRSEMGQLRRDIAALPRAESAALAAEALDDGTASIPVARLLLAVRRLGRTTAWLMIRDAGIVTGDRQVRLLSDRQRRELAWLLRDWATPTRVQS